MEYNYHKLREKDALIIQAALDSYVLSLKKEKENVFNRRIKTRIEEELYATYKTMNNFRESLNKEEDE